MYVLPPLTYNAGTLNIDPNPNPNPNPNPTQALSTSILPPRRKAFNALKRLILGLAASHTDPDAEHAGNGAGGGGGDVAAAAGGGGGGGGGAEGMNPFWKAAGYPGPPRRRTPQDGSQSAVKVSCLHKL